MTDSEIQSYLNGTNISPEDALKKIMLQTHPHIRMTKLRIHKYKCKILYTVTVECDYVKKDLFGDIPHGTLYDVYKMILNDCELV